MHHYEKIQKYTKLLAGKAYHYDGAYRFANEFCNPVTLRYNPSLNKYCRYVVTKLEDGSMTSKRVDFRGIYIGGGHISVHVYDVIQYDIHIKLQGKKFVWEDEHDEWCAKKVFGKDVCPLQVIRFAETMLKEMLQDYIIELQTEMNSI